VEIAFAPHLRETQYVSGANALGKPSPAAIENAATRGSVRKTPCIFFFLWFRLRHHMA